ncbi:MAG: hypothetical protein OXU98_01645 [Gammaproteobacteria bacterium]|nr:hypothetical protein [Gammaproteobacteria bacterium]
MKETSSKEVMIYRLLRDAAARLCNRRAGYRFSSSRLSCLYS